MSSGYQELAKEFSGRFGESILKVASRAPNPERKRVLELNQSVRQAHEQMAHLDIGSLVLQIPELDYYVLMRRFPELDSRDAEIQRKAWDKFLRDPRSEPYRVRRNDGKTPAQVRRAHGG